jgi:hypothetical protein
MLQGQAGVWAVASQLALRGLIPMFPGVDVGYDLVLTNGLKLQVRTATLTITGGKREKYPYCAYNFGLRRDCWYLQEKRRRGTYATAKPFSEIADFFVLWGIDENRFFIVPTSVKVKSIYFPTRDFAGNWIQRKQRSTKRMDDKLQTYESRWDLLDVGAITQNLVDSAVPAATPIKEAI